MNNDTLVHMANRIGHFFEAMPDREQALADIADHVRKFWEPRMRRQMVDYLDQEGGDGLSELVLTALVRHRPMLEEGLDPADDETSYGHAPSRSTGRGHLPGKAS